MIKNDIYIIQEILNHYKANNKGLQIVYSKQQRTKTVNTIFHVTWKSIVRLIEKQIVYIKKYCSCDIDCKCKEYLLLTDNGKFLAIDLGLKYSNTTINAYNNRVYVRPKRGKYKSRVKKKNKIPLDL